MPGDNKNTVSKTEDNKNTVSKTENVINQVACVAVVSSTIRALSVLNPATAAGTISVSKPLAGYLCSNNEEAVNLTSKAIQDGTKTVYNEVIKPLHDARIRDDANNYKEYGNNPNLNFDPIAPLAGHYDKTNIIQNVSNTGSNFNNSFSTALNARHNDDFHGDSKFLGSTSYSSNSNYTSSYSSGGGGVSFSIDCELI